MYYHVWFPTKYRLPILVGYIRKQVLGTFCECIERHKYKVLEYNADTDHMHLLIEASDKTELFSIMRTLKSVSAKEVFLWMETPHFRVGNNIFIDQYYRRKPVVGKRHFWARRYNWKIVPYHKLGKVRKYIINNPIKIKD